MEICCICVIASRGVKWRERERESRQFPFHDISGRERIAEDDDDDDDGDNPMERDKIQPGGSSGTTLHNSSSAERVLSRARSARTKRDEIKRRTTRAESLTADDMFTRVCVRACVEKSKDYYYTSTNSFAFFLFFFCFFESKIRGREKKHHVVVVIRGGGQKAKSGRVCSIGGGEIYYISFGGAPLSALSSSAPQKSTLRHPFQVRRRHKSVKKKEETRIQ